MPRQFVVRVSASAREVLGFDADPPELIRVEELLAASEHPVTEKLLDASLRCDVGEQVALSVKCGKRRHLIPYKLVDEVTFQLHTRGPR